MTRHIVCCALLTLSSCRAPLDVPCDALADAGDLTLNEVVSKNEGLWIDQTGATDDFVEIVNTSERPLQLADYSLSDSSNQQPLFERRLAPGARALLWLDGSPEQGSNHLSFRIASSGERLRLSTCGATIDSVRVPALAENQVYARHPDGTGPFDICAYATPTAPNGSECSPPNPYGLVEGMRFSEFAWPDHHPSLPRPLALSELVLHPANYIELQNTGEVPLDTDDFLLEIAPIAPGTAFPSSGEGTRVSLPARQLEPGEFLVVPLTAEHTDALELDPLFEGVVSLFERDGNVIDRIDFLHVPEGRALTRPSWTPERPVYCEELTPGAPNECTLLPERPVGDRLRGLRTASDFARLTEGGSALGTAAVKLVVDVVQDRATHFLGSERWPLHYTFVREVMDGEPELDRCDETENALFYDGWRAFSQSEYFQTVGRRTFLATLVEHGATGHRTLEFAPGDRILPEDLRDTFFTATERVLSPEQWAFRPQDEEQIASATELDGRLPIVSQNAPFANLVYQPLAHGTGYGVLTHVPSAELHSTALGSRVLLVTDNVPNDIPLVGGLITEAFQTPLSHVNVLSQSRGTPNMALRKARDDERIQAHLGKLVRLTVSGNDFSITQATVEEAASFWETLEPSGPAQSPRIDHSVTELVDLRDASLADLPALGAKAAQFAELYRVLPRGDRWCRDSLPFRVPEKAFAVPVVHSLGHYEASGARRALNEATKDERFASDALYRAEKLEQVRELVLGHPVDPELLERIAHQVRERFGDQRVRFRSSSNAEDLLDFNGAGLYTSKSAAIGDRQRPIADALKAVWASLYNARAYDERDLSRIDEQSVGMGVLVHASFPYEATNGVGVSRDVTNPNRGDLSTINVQAGEASVTNPAPGVSTELFTFGWSSPPTKTRFSASNLTYGEPVLQPEEERAVACALAAVHQHFRPLLDPNELEPWFAMEIEFKLEYPSRQLIVKQARPHVFGGFDEPTDCRSF